MNILFSIKKIIQRINIADKRTKNLYAEYRYTSNPFAFVPNRTYVWVEKVKDFNHCETDIFPKEKKQNKRDY